MNLASEYTGQILTPALLIDVEAVERNLEITLQRLSGDAERWRPRVKTAKLDGTITDPSLLPKNMQLRDRHSSLASQLDV